MIRAALAALVISMAAIGPAYAQRAVIRGLDKVTGQARDYTLTVGRAARIGSLEVTARSCSKSAPEETPEMRTSEPTLMPSMRWKRAVRS